MSDGKSNGPGTGGPGTGEPETREPNMGESGTGGSGMGGPGRPAEAKPGEAARPASEETPPGNGAAGPEAAAPGVAPGAESPLVEGEIPQPVEEDPVAKLEAEVATLKDQLLRALAETENVRRRGQREREDSAKFAAAPLLKDLLGVADNLGMALDSLSEEIAADERVAPLIDGLKLTQKELAAVFERHNVRKLDPMGERLDPHRHEAMFEIEDASKPNGTVVQVLQPGYMLHDRLLRPARVGVSKGGGPKSANDNAGGDAPGSHVDTSA